ncbi:MAG: winged helix DNA-binding domain-containing protein [Gemmatimonadota bacterium]
MNLLERRLAMQHVSGAPMDSPSQVVELLGAVQSQDYIGAKWSLGLRVRAATDQAIDAAFSQGTFLRTHVLRPTWHFVSPNDIRWMLQLTAPHVHALNAYYYRQTEVDAAVFTRCMKLLTKALEAQELTRKEVAAIFNRHGIETNTLRLAVIMMRAELDAIVCSGAMRGKQHTYALLARRAPNAKTIPRDEALGELARRFFTGHAPATLKHFVWWSGLSVKDAKAGLELVRTQLRGETIDDQVFWSGPTRHATRTSMKAYLVPEYDEALTGARDLGSLDLPSAPRRRKWSDSWYRPIIVNGRRAGTWRRTIGKSLLIETNLFTKLTHVQEKAVCAAAARYGRFLGLAASVAPHSPR